MFGSIGMPELVIILVIALIIFGPRKLPELGRSLGRSIGEFRRASNELRSTLEEEIRVEEQKGTAQKSASASSGDPDGPTSRAHRRLFVRHVALGPLAKLAAFRNRKPPGPAEIGPARPDPPERIGDDDLEGDDGGRMSFLDHLDELRRRLVAAALSLAAGTVVAFFFIDRIFTFIMRPLYEKLPAGSKLIYTEPTEAFFLKLKIALLAGVVIGAPLIMLQLWLFIAPGLYAREKRFALPFIVMASIFFVGGAAFNHYILFPIAWVFLAGFSTDYMMFMPRIAPVFSLYAMLMLAMGVIFEMPAVILVLARMGLATAGFLWRNVKYAILIIFIASAVITPTGDPMTQALMAGPMVALYFVSIGLAWIFGKKRRRTGE